MEKFLIVGSGGREAAFARRLADDVIVYAVLHHENPSITKYVTRTGGTYIVSSADDPKTIVEFAKLHDVDYVFVNADLPLANGVVDALLQEGIKAIGGTKDAARIEWDKIYSIELLQKKCPRFTPFYMTATNYDELDLAVAEFQRRGLKLAVKPKGLTGGKGVRIMPEHLPTYNDCTDYARTLIDRDGHVLLVERLDGIEFTVMGFTDGNNMILAPASYDYPFRHEDDHGPGTGGMGCFTASEMRLPFMSISDMDDCHAAMKAVIDELRARRTPLCGILNGGFFKTRNGIKFMEFNSRLGDPEGINILSVLNGSFSALLKQLWHGTLSEKSVSFAQKATVVKYMVASEYPDPSPESYSFIVDADAVSKTGVETFFASCVRTGPDTYKTLKKSRVVAFGAVSDDVDTASDMIDSAIRQHMVSDLQYRRDIGSKSSLEKLEKTARLL